ncbi:protein GVQW3-like [Eupeodes corollae]|uniref:protein GVQW3-like n=1 Tax=Eupeodes corollae TaxID=290404 RepID=UPI002493827C|nr:protein GVQW3-like [Eupeodes corollae]
MEKLENRAVIKYFYLKGLKPKEIKEEMDSTLGTSCPSYSTIKQWVSEFKKGRVSTSNEPRSRRPVEVTNPDMIEKIHQIVLEDRRLKVGEIAKTCKMSNERVQNILHQHLPMQKLCARWVPRLLTAPAHKSIVAMAKINDLKFELMPHPPLFSRPSPE